MQICRLRVSAPQRPLFTELNTKATLLVPAKDTFKRRPCKTVISNSSGSHYVTGPNVKALNMITSFVRAIIVLEPPHLVLEVT
ncbi:hypothetical protein AtubIFM61612_009229 [Aspergillus tubingensis]|nr:hypothetical protein AtubIFM61612_009229 [Aspergillus tubingensis]